MMGRAGRWLLMASVVPVLVGCANKPDPRIAYLEEENSDLKYQLERKEGEVAGLRGDLQAVSSAKGSWEQALLQARSEAERLRRELDAERSKPVAQAEPAERVPDGWEKVPGGAMIALEGSVLFAPGKAVLRNEAKSSLNSVVSEVRGRFASHDIIVIGHTDDTPIKKSGWKDNWELSTQRALAVVRYLQDQGVPGPQMLASGCGEFRPRADAKSEAARKRNRRVEIFALQPTS